MAVMPSVGQKISAASHAAASSYYGQKATPSNRGTPSGYKWKSTATTGTLIRVSDLEVDSVSYKITVNWTVPQTGVTISCTGCTSVTDTSHYTGSTVFTCTSRGTKTIAITLTGGSSANCGVYTASTTQAVNASGSTTKTLKLAYYVVHGTNTRGLQKVPAAYASYNSLGTTSGGWLYTNNAYGVHCGAGSQSAFYASQYSTVYATVVCSTTSVLSANPSSDGTPWVTNETYATYISGSGTKSCSKPSGNIYVLLSTAVANATIKVTDWYVS